MEQASYLSCASIAIIILSSILFLQEVSASPLKSQDSKEQRVEAYADPFEEQSRLLDKIFGNRIAIWHLLPTWQENDYIFNNTFNRFSYHIEAADKRYIYYITIPGYDKENINIELQGEYLIIKAQGPKNTKEKKDATPVTKEENHLFYQRLSLPRDINKNTISSSLKNGILTIILERTPQPKKVDTKIIPIN